MTDHPNDPYRTADGRPIAPGSQAGQAIKRRLAEEAAAAASKAKGATAQPSPQATPFEHAQPSELAKPHAPSGTPDETIAGLFVSNGAEPQPEPQASAGSTGGSTGPAPGGSTTRAKTDSVGSAEDEEALIRAAAEADYHLAVALKAAELGYLILACDRHGAPIFLGEEGRKGTRDPLTLVKWQRANRRLNFHLAMDPAHEAVEIGDGAKLANLMRQKRAKTLASGIQIRRGEAIITLFERDADRQRLPTRRNLVPGISVYGQYGSVPLPGAEFDDGTCYEFVEGRDFTARPDAPLMPEWLRDFILDHLNPKKEDEAAPENLKAFIRFLEKAKLPAANEKPDRIIKGLVRRALQLNIESAAAIPLILEHWNTRLKHAMAVEELTALAKRFYAEEGNTNRKTTTTAGAPPFTFTFKGGQQIPESSYANTRIGIHALELGAAYNAFTGYVEITAPSLPWSGNHGHIMDDNIYVLLRNALIDHFKLDANKSFIFDAVIGEGLQNRFHPVQRYLEAGKWDGEKRLDTWLIKCFGARDTPYVRAVSRKVLIGAVARAMNPGCKYDYVLVLEGVQGKEKSAAVGRLAPDSSWYSSSVPRNLDKADAVAMIQGKWIVELPELERLAMPHLEELKNYLVRQTDRARFAYARVMQDYPRSCIFIATTNRHGILVDHTGNRRYWPVAIRTVQPALVAKMRDQLWAEAVTAHLVGELPMLSPELEIVAAEEQEKRYTRTTWEDRLREHVDGKTPIDRVSAVHLLTNVLNIPSERQTQRHSSELREIMQSRLGWSYKSSIRFEDDKITSGYVRGDAEDLID